MPKDHKVSGVGGWLTLLIIGLTLLGPLAGFGKLSGEFDDAIEKYPQLASNPDWKAYVHVSWLIFAAAAATSIAAGYRLWSIHEITSVRFAVRALWIAGPIANVVYLIAATAIFGTSASGSAVAQMLGGLVGSCIAAGVWTAYLKRSLRVKNTYLPCVSEMRHIEPPIPSASPETNSGTWWRRQSKAFRLWCFGSILWAVGVLLYVVGFDPFDNGSWSYMDSDEYFRMFFVMFVPPLFVGASKHAYTTWFR